MTAYKQNLPSLAFVAESP